MVKCEAGVVFNIQKYSLHDGPGTRTLVFLKGCPLRCLWCANPESHQMGIQQRGEHTFGQQMRVDEVVDIVLQDMMFYQSSGGGLTLSGGEPAAQPAFAEAILRQCKQEGIHCALESCGQAPWEIFQKLMPHVDLFLYDIKHLNKTVHKQLTGVGNTLILDNLHRLLQSGATLRLRMPLIPHCNDGENLHQTIALAQSLQQSYPHFQGLDILPYHIYGLRKYEQLGLAYSLPQTRHSEVELQHLEHTLPPNTRIVRH